MRRDPKATRSDIDGVRADVGGADIGADDDGGRGDEYTDGREVAMTGAEHPDADRSSWHRDHDWSPLAES